MHPPTLRYGVTGTAEGQTPSVLSLAPGRLARGLHRSVLSFHPEGCDSNDTFYSKLVHRKIADSQSIIFPNWVD